MSAGFGRLAAVLTACILAGAACGEDESAPAAKKTSEAEPSERMSEADRRARDRARTMIHRGERCDEGETGARDLESCRVACRLGHSNSCGWLGDAYAAGAGVPQDLEQAARFYRQACEGGSGLGCEGLARMMLEGSGDVGADTDRNAAAEAFAEARTVYRVHCSQQHAASCRRLAGLYRDGLGGVRDESVAASYEQRADALTAARDRRTRSGAD